MKILKALGILIFAFFISASFQGGVESQKQEYPALEVERPLLLPKGFFEIRGQFSYFDAQKYFNDDKKPTDFPEDADWRMFNAQIEIGWGALKWLEVGARIPYLAGKEFYAKGQNIGDVWSYLLFSFYKKESVELGARLEISFPTGEHNRKMGLRDSEYYLEDLVTGNPYSDFLFGLDFCWHQKNFALRAKGGYVLTQAGEVKKGIEGLEQTVKIDTGDKFFQSIDFLYQLNERWVLIGGVSYFNQQADKEEGESLDNPRELLSILGGVEYQPQTNYELFFQIGASLVGRNQPVAYPIVIGIENRF